MLLPPQKPSYRFGVGIVVFNPQGLVLMGERKDMSGAWQFPQGGIDVGEDPWKAAQRELQEETGIKPQKIRLLSKITEWLSYDFPADMPPHPVYGHHLGQRQKWFAVRFLGTDQDIRLDLHHPVEFGRADWRPLAEAPGLIVDFKRAMYERIAIEFKKFAA